MRFGWSLIFSMLEPHKKDLQNALNAHRAGRIDLAKKVYEQLYKLYPQSFDVVHLLGITCFQSGDLQRAGNLIAEALKLNPKSAAANNSLGSIHKAQRRFEDARARFDKAIELKPDYPEAFVNRGSVSASMGFVEDALLDFQRALKLLPRYPDAYVGQGIALKELNQLNEALKSFEAAIAINPRHPEALGNKGNLLLDLGRADEAVEVLDSVIAIRPDIASNHYNLGNASLALSRPHEALASYDRAISLKPDYAEAYSNRGNALKELKRLDEALASYDKAISLKSDYPEVYSNRGNALKELKRLDEAIASYDKAISLKPDYAEVYSNRGNALKELKRLDEAIASYDKAISLKPDYAEAYSGRGGLLTEASRFEEAIADFDRAILLDANLELALGARLAAKSKICVWHDFNLDLTKIKAQALEEKLVIDPFMSLTVYDDPQLQKLIAQVFVRNRCPAFEDVSSPSYIKSHPRIRVGYYTSDFRNHPGATLMAELFEEHDHKNFEFYAFSFSPRTGDALQQRIAKAFANYIDINDKSDQQVSELSRDLEIDIAINRNGFTKYARTNIFARRAAPIQVNYLGYPGTTGASYMDYIIADKVLIPESHREFFSEKIVYMPDSYQANDSKREISQKSFSREEFGLPKTGFVFCCFNNTHKIVPDAFASWMRILQRVEGSVLWLYEANDTVAGNLRREASAHGIDPTRLVFGERMPRDEHLARHRLADLFLDTLPYNAHTTASDALWAGLPVLTCIGNSFAARVAASLLTALDMKELIVDDKQKYEELAVSLAKDPISLGEIRDKLNRNRLASNLFSGKAFARNIEAAYKEMFERHQRGLPPDHIFVSRCSG
jgi:protein O-GlcNAc transferase